MSSDRAPWDDWRLSPKGLVMLTALEGGARAPYKDQAGFWTAGVGHKLPNKAAGASWRADWSAWLEHDTAESAACLNRHLKITLQQNEVDALVMLIFNIGDNAFIGSHLRKALSDGPEAEVKHWWLVWHYVHGKASNGLIARRAAEWRLFSEGEYSRQ